MMRMYFATQTQTVRLVSTTFKGMHLALAFDPKGVGELEIHR